MPEPTEVTHTYYAKSILLDGQTWFNIVSIVGLWLENQGTKDLIPNNIQPYITQLILLANMFLRWNNVRRPVAFIAPGRTKEVEVRSLTDKTGTSL